MTVPDYQVMMRSALEIPDDLGPQQFRTMIELIAERCDLSEQERAVSTPAIRPSWPTGSAGAVTTPSGLTSLYCRCAVDAERLGRTVGVAGEGASTARDPVPQIVTQPGPAGGLSSCIP